MLRVRKTTAIICVVCSLQGCIKDDIKLKIMMFVIRCIELVNDGSLVFVINCHLHTILVSLFKDAEDLADGW